jgi:NADPH-dependent 2,4-dienoyl-CoA reductase/sulfur reductase-like enzyme
MDREMMDKVVQMHVEAARRAEKAGFDFVELQTGHGYLLAQFLSPAVNDRTDEFGGSLENRMRFPLEVVRAVVQAVNIPVIARVSGDEMIPNGFHLDEMAIYVQQLEKEGVAALHVIAGTACGTPPWFFQHMFIPKGKTWQLAGELKKKVNIPVIFLGRIHSAEDIKTIKEKYNGEYFALGRALVADPDFVGKYLGAVEGTIRPCLACSEGCLGGVKAGKGLGCVVNPLANTGLPALEKTTTPKHYAVVGGGLAGMEAAIDLKKKGHKVVLYEKEELGGQFNLAYLPPHKESLKDLVDYYKTEMDRLEVPVKKEDATAKTIQAGNYDGVVMATGALPAVPPIKGLKEYYWTEFLEDDHLPSGKKILVIGGGLIGMEVASKLVNNNNQVVIVEMLEEIARGMEMIEKAMTLKELKAKETEIITQHTVTGVDGSKVKITGEVGDRILEGIDHIVVATGMKSYHPFEKEEGMPPLHFIGDARKVGKAQDAIREAYALALEL